MCKCWNQEGIRVVYGATADGSGDLLYVQHGRLQVLGCDENRWSCVIDPEKTAGEHARPSLGMVASVLTVGLLTDTVLFELLVEVTARRVQRFGRLRDVPLLLT